ncbi:MAG: glucohydrolase, partial [Lachnospiraceae bacterium]|nr:glucohydrolase [Lachnospiraceae bacterium]
LTEVYKKLIALRKRYNALRYGEFKVLNKRRDRFTYERYDKNEKFVIDCNLSGTATRGAFDGEGYKLIYAPLYGHAEEDILLPYEVRIWKQ